MDKELATWKGKRPRLEKDTLPLRSTEEPKMAEWLMNTSLKLVEQPQT